MFSFPEHLYKPQNVFSGNVQGLQTSSTCDGSHLVVTWSSVATTTVLCKLNPCGVLGLQLYHGDLQAVFLEIFYNSFFPVGPGVPDTN